MQCGYGTCCGAAILGLQRDMYETGCLSGKDVWEEKEETIVMDNVATDPVPACPALGLLHDTNKLEFS